jgi:ribosomal protein S18 acetylase RimI-like enzyme
VIKAGERAAAIAGMIDIRHAVREDSRDIARLFLISTDGLAEYIWSLAAEPGETVMETGARRYVRQGVVFSYENCLMAEKQGVTVGMAHSYEMTEDADSGGSGDPVMKPYGELEDYGSLYLSGMAVLEEHRNAGIGKALMGAVSRRARDLSLGRISLICFERNEGAMRLYRRLGFREIGRRAVVPHPALHYPDGDAVLLAREIAPPET